MSFTKGLEILFYIYVVSLVVDGWFNATFRSYVEEEVKKHRMAKCQPPLPPEVMTVCVHIGAFVPILNTVSILGIITFFASGKYKEYI